MFETPPKVVPGGAKFRESLNVGSTSLSAKARCIVCQSVTLQTTTEPDVASQEVEDLLKKLSREYLGDRYHLLYRNVRETTAQLSLRDS